MERKRNLVALDMIFDILDGHKEEYGYEVLRLLVSSSINLIKLSDKKASSQMPYWLPKKEVRHRRSKNYWCQRSKWCIINTVVRLVLFWEILLVITLRRAK